MTQLLTDHRTLMPAPVGFEPAARTAKPIEALASAEPISLVLTRAIRIYQDRRRRDQQFGPLAEMFGEPAWDMLLDLFIAGESNRRLSVGDACIGAQINQTSGLRIIAALEELNLIVRTTDPHDGRRRFVDLTEHGRDLMLAYLMR